MHVLEVIRKPLPQCLLLLRFHVWKLILDLEIV